MRVNIELPEGFTPAYNKIYLDSVIIAHKSGYNLFNTNERYKEYNTASLVDAYMRTSKARSGMDNGGRAL